MRFGQRHCMIVSITNTSNATSIVFILLFLALIISIQRREISEWLPASVTQELKGLAILMIVFSHIGYFLVSDTEFLRPLSNMAGIGVNMFLFFSGFGLMASMLKKDLTIREFYQKRLVKLFTPFWLMLGVFISLDFFFLHIHRTAEFLRFAVFGIFAHADLYQDFNSPLWYLTLTIGYYTLFPIVFSKKYPWISALLLYVAGYIFVSLKPEFFDYVIHLYKIHIIAFPLGVLLAWGVTLLEKPKTIHEALYGKAKFVYLAVLTSATALFIYANIHSGVGESPDTEQWMSILATLSLIIIFVLKKFEFRTLTLFGVYSYEVYLWHWPLMYRYDFLYKYFGSRWLWLPTLLYLGVFLSIGVISKKIVDGTFAKAIRTRVQSQK